MEQHRKQRKSYWLESVIGVCGLVLMFAGSQKGFAQQTATKSTLSPASSAVSSVPFGALLPGATLAEAKSKATAEEEEATARPSKPGSEGIKIHGHWVLQVKNADGTLGERREFNNSLVTSPGGVSSGGGTSGAAFLAAAISGNMAVGNPAIGFVQGTLNGDPGQWCAIIPYYALPTISCYAFSSANSLWNYSNIVLAGQPLVYNQLGLNITATYTPSANLVLSGNFTVPTGLTAISAVETLYGGCVAMPPGGTPTYASLTGTNPVRTADIAAKDCTQNYLLSGSSVDNEVVGAFTSTAVTNGSGVASPLSVTPGQVITVTVTISFS